MSAESSASGGGAAEQTSEHGGAPVAAPRQRYTREQLDAWGAPYGRQFREVRRWINKGAAANPPDPPPLADPGAMCAWWPRHMKQRVPVEILGASLSARQLAAAPANDNVVVDPSPAPDPVLAGEPDDSSDVRFARSLVADYQRHLGDAIRLEDLDKVTYWSLKHKDAMETLRKQQVSDRAARKNSDLLISRAAVECEIFAVIKILIQMQAHREKRVREHLLTALPSIDPQLIEHVGAALAAVGERELDLFRNLKSVQSAEDVSFHLAA